MLSVIRDGLYFAALGMGVISIFGMFKQQPNWMMIRGVLIGALLIGGIGFAIGLAVGTPVPLDY